jgi:hypothetical protein
MVPVPLSRLHPSRDEATEDWPWLDQDVAPLQPRPPGLQDLPLLPTSPGPQLHPTAHLPPAPRTDRPWRAPHPPLQRLDRRPTPPSGLGA